MAADAEGGDGTRGGQNKGVIAQPGHHVDTCTWNAAHSCSWDSSWVTGHENQWAGMHGQYNSDWCETPYGWNAWNGTSAGWSGYASGSPQTGGTDRFGTNTDEQTAYVHFGKTHRVLSDLIAANPQAFQSVCSFLDLGCAPGGFASRLLEEFPSAIGLGISLPVHDGGFPMVCVHEQLHIQSRDLMSIEPEEVLNWCSGLVDVCMADAQDLGRRTNSATSGGGKGAGKGRAGKGASKSYTGGVGATLQVLGIWALTLQEFALGLGALRQGGTFVFRFAWRGRGVREEAWYKEATYRILSFLLTHFAEMVHFKSESSHQADSCFYVVASGFLREAFEAVHGVENLQEAISRVLKCDRANDLPWCMEAFEADATAERRARIDKILLTVSRLREIGRSSRRHLEDKGREDPDAVLWISPVPFSLTMPRIRECLERFGKILNISRRSHAVGAGADALVHFTQAAHAQSALEAIVHMQVLGPNITARRISDGKK